VGGVDVDRDDTRDEGASERAGEMEERARRMEGRSSELEGDIAEAREDWRSKQSGGAPGAQSEEAAEDLVDESEEPEDFELSEEPAREDGDEDEGDES
jgi:hypothetical protein